MHGPFNDDVCAVCLDELVTNVHVACCKHAFHEACCKSLRCCPLCRVSWPGGTPQNLTVEVNDDDDIDNVDYSEPYDVFMERIRVRDDRERDRERERERERLDVLDPTRIVRRREAEERQREHERQEAELDRLNPSRVSTRRLQSLALNYNALRIMSGLGGLLYN